MRLGIVLWHIIEFIAINSTKYLPISQPEKPSHFFSQFIDHVRIRKNLVSMRSSKNISNKIFIRIYSKSKKLNHNKFENM